MTTVDPAAKPSKFLTVAAVCVVVGALYLARDVMVPLAVALLLTFLLAPLAHRVERLHIRRTPAALLVVLFSFIIIGSVGWLITDQVRDLATRLSDYRYDIEKKVEDLQHRLGHGPWATLSQMAQDVAASQPATGQAAAPRGTSGNPMAVEITGSPTTPESAFKVVGNALEIFIPLAQSLIVVVFVIFMLIQREDIRDRLIRLVGHGQLTVTTQALNEAATRVSRYLVAQSMINGVYGIVVGTGLHFLRIPNAPLWGLVCALLRFIPYLGIWIGALVPIILSFVVPQGYYAARPLLTLLFFVVIELTTANVAEPLLFSTRTGVSPIAILVAAVFWTWLWGGIGLLLSTPLTVVLAVVGKYVPQLRFLDVLLGDQPVLAPPERYYQRLLADDPEDAEDLLDEFEKSHTTEQLYSQIILPALQMSRVDHQRGVLDDKRRDIIRQAIKDQVERHRAAPPRTPAPDTQQQAVPRDAVINILCIPANDQADEIAAIMFATLLAERGYSAQPRSADALASEMVDGIAAMRADLVVVCALPPGAIAHARYLCKRIQTRFPELLILFGLWNTTADMRKTKSRISNSPNVHLAMNMEEGMTVIHQMIQPLLIRPAPAPEPATANPV